MSLQAQLCCWFLFVLLFDLTLSQQCDNSTFPTIVNTQCMGLTDVIAGSYQECEQSCCNSVGCTVFQWCPNDQSVTCWQNHCYIGTSNNCNGTQTGWQGRSRPQPPLTFSFSNMFSSHMVLQQTPFKSQITGISPIINDNVVVILMDNNGNTIQTVNASSTSKIYKNQSVTYWIAQFAAIKASIDGQSYKIKAQSLVNNSASATIIDILFGDVYLCGGQSNMQFTTAQAMNASEAIQEANDYPNIRLFTAALVGSNQPEFELISVEESWEIAKNTSVGHNQWGYFSAVCWFFGKNLYDKLKYPIGLISSNYGGTAIREWMSYDALNQCPNETGSTDLYKVKTLFKFGENYDFTEYNQYKLKYGNTTSNGILWNAMIVPFLTTTIRGVIWYQGESDANGVYASEYQCAFPAMIHDWRLKWSLNSDTSIHFPFGYIGLSVMGDSNENPCNGNIACLDVAIVRYGQTANYGYVPNEKMFNVYTATAIDLGDPTSPYGDIHPRYKQQVSQRLSNAAMNLIYNDTTNQGLFNGPIADKVSFYSSNYSLIINFRNVSKSGMILKNMDGFEIFDSKSSRWIYKSSGIQLAGLNEVSIYTHPTIPSKVRYNWYQAPCLPENGIFNCGIYDVQTELPAMPFIFDVI